VSRGVLDASALLALLQGEPGGPDVAALIPDVAMSAVNLSEVVGKLIDAGASEADARLATGGLGVRIVDFDEVQAFEAAGLRAATRSVGLSLGDRACIALARRLGVPAVTTDRAWARLRLGVTVRVVR
jgi:PIN domain nuclease of toxin-antitoxin system